MIIGKEEGTTPSTNVTKTIKSNISFELKVPSASRDLEKELIPQFATEFSHRTSHHPLFPPPLCSQSTLPSKREPDSS